MKRPDNFSKFHDLRQEFPYFSYDSYHYNFKADALEISFTFNLSGKYYFNPHIRIPYKKDIFLPFDSLSSDALNNLIFHIGMIEMISYWKAACPPKVIVKPHGLSAARLNFWKKVYYQGLGEFFYLNSIAVEEDDFMEIVCQEGNPAVSFPVRITGGCLVPVGGGKDSAVSMGLLNKSGEDWLPFVINPGKTSRDIILAAGRNEDQTIEFYREIHPLLLELNREGFLNGHTPFSALLAFYSLLAAYLTGRNDIILSNESSANEVTVPGTSINHQYSKSVGFERDFREYVRDSISPAFNYFSLLRPLSELQIARLFSQMPEFLPHFRSCNVGSKTGTWCGKCPKCLFTFIILSPFLEPDKLEVVFGKNLLDDPNLENILEQLSGIQETKPFECIGTVDEVNLALDMAADRYRKDELPFLIRSHQKQSSLPDLSGVFPLDTSGEHFLPHKYILMLKKALR